MGNNLQEAKHITIGKLGEQVTVNQFISDGFSIIDRNYSKKWGEIDIIAEKDNKIHFIEVKTVSYETKRKFDDSVTHETWQPEDNVHVNKLKKFTKTIESWILENNCEKEWFIDVVAVKLVPREKIASIKVIWNVIE